MHGRKNIKLIFISVRIIKEMPGSVASGTPCIINCILFRVWLNKSIYEYCTTHRDGFYHIFKASALSNENLLFNLLAPEFGI